MKSAIVPLAALLLAITLPGCQSSHEKGVTSNYHSQWTNVGADVKTTTKAAEAVLNDADLKDVSSSATNVDGEAKGKKADGTKVNVAVRKEKDSTSQVSVTVGKMGDPELGAELARKIKDRAETGSSSATPRP
jgi:Tfp pilus assembly protein PilX